MAAIAVANAFGDVIAQDGALLGAPHGDSGELLRSAELIAEMTEPPYPSMHSANNTTLVCVMTDAALDKRRCAILARIASAGIARAVNPAFTPVDGDVVFFLASGSESPPAPALAASWALTVIGTVAAIVTAAAIRDAVRQAA